MKIYHLLMVLFLLGETSCKSVLQRSGTKSVPNKRKKQEEPDYTNNSNKNIPSESTTFNLTSPTRLTTDSQVVKISGEVMSRSRYEQWCGLALYVMFKDGTKKTILADENVIKVRSGDMLSISQMFDVRDVPAANPDNITDTTVVEACMGRRPEDTVKAIDILRTCLDADSCAVVGFRARTDS